MKAVFESRGLLIDMDGVLWRGSKYLPGVKDFFATLRSRNLPFQMVTNNATASPASTVGRLSALEVDISESEVLTSAYATAQYLRSVLYEGASVFAIGEDAVLDALKQAGFQIQNEPDSVQAVIVGFDREISWKKLAQAAFAIQSGALFIGTNPDVSFPTERGQAPGNGAFVLALEAATNVKPVIVGKPEAQMFTQAVEHMGVDPAAALMLGDRLETDILGAQQVGIATALLLTGVTDRQQSEASEIKPDFVFEDLPAFTSALRGGPA